MEDPYPVNTLHSSKAVS